MANSSKLPSGTFHFSHLIAGMALVGVLVATGWFYYQRHSLNQQIATLQSEITDTQTELNGLREKQLDSIIVAQQTVTQVETSAIVWSEVIAHLQKITPLDVFYRSYSASADGKMTVSVLTDTYESAAELISVFSSDEQFSDPFVSSLAKGSTESGAGVVSFGVTFNVQ